MAYSDLFDSISLIKLETTKESLIGNIDKLISYNNFYFILDMAQSKAVFEFDNKGKFLRKIGQKGKGPGEYLEPHDIAVDQFSGRIIIYDGRKLLFYDFEGKFIEEIKLSFSFRSFSVLSKDVLAYYFDNSLKEKDLHKLKFNLLFVNKKGKILSQSFDVDENIYPTSGSRSFFYQYNQELLVSPSYSNTIYSVSTESIVPKFVINFDKYAIPKDFVLNAKTDNDFYRELKKSNYAFLRDYFETPNYLAFSIVYKSMIYSCFYSKKTGVIKFANSFVNNMYGLLTESSIISVTKGDIIVGYTEPSNNEETRKIMKNSLTDGLKLKQEYLKYVDSWKSSNEFKRSYMRKVDSTFFNPTKEEVDITDSLSSFDNPVLIVHKLKDF
jgi:hypothetical protein